jgi:hypothetical protein
LPFNWVFSSTIPHPKSVLAELRRWFMEEWRSGKYTREELIERYRTPERTFWYTIKIRIAKTGDKKETSEKIERWDTFFRTILGRPDTALSQWTLQLKGFLYISSTRF